MCVRTSFEKQWNANNYVKIVFAENKCEISAADKPSQKLVCAQWSKASFLQLLFYVKSNWLLFSKFVAFGNHKKQIITITIKLICRWLMPDKMHRHANFSKLKQKGHGKVTKTTKKCI